MSADNYLWVRPWRGKWYAQQEFASSRVDRRRKPDEHAIGPFESKDEALMAAFHEESTSYYEYGVMTEPWQ